MDLKKFTNLLNNYPNVIRTKGYVWFDNQPDSAYLFEQAGKLTSLQEDSLWIASAPKQDQIDLLKANPQLAKNWDEEYGDRINRVFIKEKYIEKKKKKKNIFFFFLEEKNSLFFFYFFKIFFQKNFNLRIRLIL